MNTPCERLSTGVDSLDDLLGGGLLPGTLTVVVGATGIGKTQLGLHFAHAGRRREGRAGVILDMTARGDSQGHAQYARRMFGWHLREAEPHMATWGERLLAVDNEIGDCLHPFDYHGTPVARREADFDRWHDWQAELVEKLAETIAFLYGSFVRGARRVVVDGVEPVERPDHSIQLHLFEYVYHQILRKDADWVARDYFRQDFLRSAPLVMRHLYDAAGLSCLLLYTSFETMLEELVSRPLQEGDALANANTVIYMGKIREGQRLGRALYVAKHRGSPCGDRIVPYTIDGAGIRLLE